MKEFEKTKGEENASARPKMTQYLCNHCNGSGLIPSQHPPKVDSENYPHVAIIGAGIGGVALAVACLHRGIPFTLYERDPSFNARAQGYGLTLQQASNAIKELGLFSLKDGSRSSRHVVHTTQGEEIGEWGVRTHAKTNKTPKRINVHIPRQALRLALLEQLYQDRVTSSLSVCVKAFDKSIGMVGGSIHAIQPPTIPIDFRRFDASRKCYFSPDLRIGSPDAVQWGHRFICFRQCEDQRLELSFQVNKEIKHAKADLVVGADGIRSVVRSFVVGEELTPLRYLGYMVILGICPLEALQGVESPLLDSATVFQTVNGHERIYVMPYSLDSVMWQLSFPMTEEEAKALSAQGAQALQEEACRRTHWHKPIPQIVSATRPTQISGYPVYDRELLKPELLEKAGAVTLLGDAAHPMSPFKGQGANQALLDALALARQISIACTPLSKWREIGIRKAVLTEFEEEMLARSASKVKDSAEAVELLHSKSVLREGYAPKGRCLREMPDVNSKEKLRVQDSNLRPMD